MREGLWVYLVPIDRPKVEIMKTILTEVLIPTMLTRRQKYMDGGIKRVRLPDEEAMPEYDEEPTPAQPRIVLTLDGEDTHLKAMYCHLIDSGLAEKNAIDLVKFPASSSKILQPCDLSPMYRAMKQGVGHSQEWVSERSRKQLSNLLAPIPPASRKTFLAFLEQLPYIVSKACNMHNLRKGWELAGLWPFDSDKVFARTAAWSKLSTKQQFGIRRNLKMLAETARDLGEVPDEDLDTMLKELLTDHEFNILTAQTIAEGPKVIKRSRKKPINHRRCIWLNRPPITEERTLPKKKKVIATAIKKAAARATANTMQEESEDSTDEADNAEDKPKQGKKSRPLQRCGNPGCDNPGGPPSCWTPCSTCDLEFCENQICQDLHEVHERLCE